MPGILISAAEAAEILDMTLSLARIRRRHHEPHGSWATTEEAAAALRVSVSNLPLMMLCGRLPYETAANGWRYVRRHQLEVIANARRDTTDGRGTRSRRS